MPNLYADWQLAKHIAYQIECNTNFLSMLPTREMLLWKKLEINTNKQELRSKFFNIIHAENEWLALFISMLERSNIPEKSNPVEILARPFIQHLEFEIAICCPVEVTIQACTPWIEKQKALLNEYFSPILPKYESINGTLSPDYTSKDAIQFICHFFDSFPVIARICTQRIEQAINSFKLFTKRLQQDFREIQNVFGITYNLSGIKSIFPLNSDLHTDAGEVLKLTFLNETSVIYKPKSSEIESFLNTVKKIINQCSKQKFFSFIPFLPRDNYYWQAEVIENQEKKNNSLTYRSSGRFLALCYAFLMEDYHVENVLFVNNDCISVDNEFFCPPLSPVKSNFPICSDPIIHNSYINSVFNCPLL